MQTVHTLGLSHQVPRTHIPLRYLHHQVKLHFEPKLKTEQKYQKSLKKFEVASTKLHSEYKLYHRDYK